MDRATIIIKKYENRRLYDTAHSRYVNLDEVAQMVQDGVDVQVLDAATGEDLTRLILTQIIAEHAKGPNSAFPLDMLRQMVMATGRVSQESALRYMKTMFEMYQNAYRALPLSPFGFMQNLGKPVSLAGAPPAAGGDNRAQEFASSPPVADFQEVQDLRRRLDELEALVAKSREMPRKAKKKKMPQV